MHGRNPINETASLRRYFNGVRELERLTILQFFVLCAAWAFEPDKDQVINKSRFCGGGDHGDWQIDEVFHGRRGWIRRSGCVAQQNFESILGLYPRRFHWLIYPVGQNHYIRTWALPLGSSR